MIMIGNLNFYQNNTNLIDFVANSIISVSLAKHVRTSENIESLTWQLMKSKLNASLKELN